MSVQHKSKCRDVRSSDRFCAGGEIGKDTCRGDSGGGAFLGNKFDPDGPLYLIGIVSSGSRFCGAGKPRGFTRLTKYVHWIKKHLR
jgi:secreted trypsin-like serine protease